MTIKKNFFDKTHDNVNIHVKIYPYLRFIETNNRNVKSNKDTVLPNLHCTRELYKSSQIKGVEFCNGCKIILLNQHWQLK